jgi:hypothetical protein
MPISIDALRNAANRFGVSRTRTLHEARSQSLRTVFLCHSHLDGQLAKGVVALLEEAGWRAYVDWEDASMPETPNRETAARIKQKIVDLDYFLFLATANSMSSRWCPWEIGYADGKKQIDRILMLPTTDGNRTHGNEYLQLYRRIEMSSLDKLGVWQPGQSTNGVLVEHL